MVWYFIGVYIINRTLHGRLEIWNFSSSVEKYFTSERSDFFQHEKRNFIYPRNHVISSIYLLFSPKTGISGNEKTNKKNTCRDFVTNSYGESWDKSGEKSWVPVKKSLKLKMLGPLCNQTVNLRTDSKTLYYSILNVTTLRQQLKRGEF